MYKSILPVLSVRLCMSVYVVQIFLCTKVYFLYIPRKSPISRIILLTHALMVSKLRIWPKIGWHVWHTRQSEKAGKLSQTIFFITLLLHSTPPRKNTGWLTRLDPAMADKLEVHVFHARGVILPPNRPHPTTHPHPALFKFLFSAGLHVIGSSLRFLSSLLGGFTPRGVVGTAPESVQVSPIHFTITSLPSWGSQNSLKRPLEVAIGSHWSYTPRHTLYNMARHYHVSSSYAHTWVHPQVATPTIYLLH